ncbi:MAG: cytochrome C [Betaproteobacteria bacterium]|jgi:hypothetical protein|nr:cytochrome C [Betaproteobacteria bacterium]MCC6246468.1 cytochrome C [Rubrivivax sp.]MCL4698286.1 cytochrome c [Burkholderiaceae bacterium]
MNALRAAVALVALAALTPIAVEAAERDTRRLAPNGHTPALNYARYCSGCHGGDGAGRPAKGVPDMRGVLGHFLRVSGGREFIVRVPGVSYTPLADADVAALMNWLLAGIAQPSLPPQAAPYTAEEVARLRSTRMADIPGTRAELVRRLRDAGYRID